MSVLVCRSLTISALSLLLACGPKPAAPTPAPAADPQEEPTPAPAPAVIDQLLGDWVSAGCGDREYARELAIANDGRWAARDLVSPCPPDAQCVWSGIVLSGGPWAADEDGLTLTDESTDERAKPRPTRLAPTGEGAVATEGDLPCTYARP